ncbi:MAG: class I SAM-dependent methyltransferase [Ktedonobacteraceae bacterium]|nr:class I SAM-dependent methyltransferase [Ktedonobacteraceae bacterium]
MDTSFSSAGHSSVSSLDQQSADKKMLHIGCGKHKVAGAVGLDITPLPGVDVVLDLDKEKLPFADNTFDIIYAHHVLEHLRNLPDVLAEIHRVCKKGALIDILVPYYTCVGAFGDPTHVRFFTYRTLEHFAETEDKERYTWFATTKFAIEKRHIGFGKLFRVLLIEFLANRWPNIYENFFAFTFPGRTLAVQMRVVKEQE